MILRNVTFAHRKLISHVFVIVAVVISWFWLVTAIAMAENVTGGGKATVAHDARIGGDNNRVRFIADLSKKVPFKVFTLADPYRVIVDLPEVRFQFPSGLGRTGKGMVSAYRYGTFAAGKSRIVIDVKHPVQVEKSFIVSPSSSQPARLVIDLVRTDRELFMAEIKARRMTEGTAEASVKQAEISADSSRTERSASGDHRPLVILDPGHGGVDPGAIGSMGTLEKDVVLRFAKILRRKIEDTGRYNVKMTRDIDTYIPLHDRVKYARNEGGSLFLSIHADSVASNRANRNQIRGASIYVLSEEASDEEAQALASLENRSDIIAGVELPESEDPVTNILIDLAQRETNNLSMFFARLQVSQMKGTVPMHGYYPRSAGFRVLKAPDIPSALIELGYLSSEHDEKELNSAKWLDRTANVILKAIHNYFNQQVARVPF